MLFTICLPTSRSSFFTVYSTYITALEAELERYSNLKIRLYQDLCDDVVSREEYGEMNLKQGDIKVIMVKDLSRLGRDYIGVGDYIEQIFPLMGVRFIAVNNSFDSMRASLIILFLYFNSF